ncbi:MAG: FIST C-terminal domain-containing protein [Burkholderiales bacterium]|nr:FIST C-terminal domain-containing protein [Burkholderiales bacterium]
MKIAQRTGATWPSPDQALDLRAIAPQLAFVFGDVASLSAPRCLPALQQALPGVTLMGCSTAGEISTGCVGSGGVVITALHFDEPAFQQVTTDLIDMADSAAAGERLARALTRPGLHSVLVLGQGVAINGSALIEGMRRVLPPSVALSGGLAGDGGAFKQTWTVSSQAVSPRQLVALGFSGPRIQLRHGSFHGWQPFGVARRVTRCEGNVLYELDGEPALDIYKRYLGHYAKDLPGSGLLFPFEMLGADHNELGLIRTILGIDEAQGSLILAGDIAPDGYLRLMHATTHSLIDGAQVAAERVRESGLPAGASLALLVSCVGRKLVMGAHVDEEIEAVAEVFGKDAVVAGFYSYGEISPMVHGLDCKLHNQTMTITYISEIS